MKTENTLENKAAFFAQYWGQKVMKSNKLFFGTVFTVDDLSMIDHEYLELTLISDIIDELRDELGPKSINLTCGSSLKQEGVDIVRQKGVLIGWRDLTVQDILDYGWAKPKEQ